MQRPRCSTNWPKMRGSTVPSRRRRSMPMRVVMASESRSGPRACQFDSVARRAVQSRPEDTHMSGHDNGVNGVNGSTGRSGHGRARRAGVSRRAFVAGAGAASVAAWARWATAQPKATITYWNGLTGADGKVMDELIDQFTRDTGIRIEQQRLPWADLYAKLQVAVPAGEGPDLALIHTVEVPHFASDAVLDAIDDGTAAGKGFRGEDYLPATWQGGTVQGKRYSLPVDVPQHILYMNVKVMKDAGVTGSDGRPRVPGSRDELV